MATRPRLSRLSRTNTMTTCRVCGKRTHSSIDGATDIQLCRECYEKAGLENEHSDGHHAGLPNKNCRECQKAPAALALPVTAPIAEPVAVPAAFPPCNCAATGLICGNCAASLDVPPPTGERSMVADRARASDLRHRLTRMSTDLESLSSAAALVDAPNSRTAQWTAALARIYEAENALDSARQLLFELS